MDAAGGYIAEILRDLQHHLHFTSLVTTTNAWGTKRNDTWNGMVGFLTRRVGVCTFVYICMSQLFFLLLWIYLFAIVSKSLL
ncbi:hypothetical protein E2C01_102759 [Portunus trituberculatus]|uniref:Ionotropic glutamate receptor L-glutamate and glycine-binding domain-containing protein n=1 Tax=Portunus trituberculatus TaxID=210409 RepID=A0A5B7K916_PORTR|nr:hypothetical protein [Portunus trituberculatus]